MITNTNSTRHGLHVSDILNTPYLLIADINRSQQLCILQGILTDVCQQLNISDTKEQPTPLNNISQLSTKHLLEDVSVTTAMALVNDSLSCISTISR